MRTFIVALSLLVLLAAGPAFGQNNWTIESTSPGASGFVGVSEDFMITGAPWDSDGVDDCEQVFDVRCEWMIDHTGDNGVHKANGVLAATLDGSEANQTAVFLSEEWTDDVVSGATWWVNYNVHLVAINAADIPNLRVRSRYMYNGVTQLVLNLVGLAGENRVQFRLAPQHVWTDSPESGNQWRLEITAIRTLTGEPAMIWVDDISVTEGGEILFAEDFPTQPSSVDIVPMDGLRLGLRTFPNPMSSQTSVRFRLDSPRRVNVQVLDVAGRVVRSLWAGRLAPGVHSLPWDGVGFTGEPVPSGVYFVRVASGADSWLTRTVKVR